MHVTWDPVAEADRYFVYRTNDDSGEPDNSRWTAIATVDSPVYDDDGSIESPKGSFWYKVKAFSDEHGTSVASSVAEGFPLDTSVLIDDFESGASLQIPAAPWIVGSHNDVSSGAALGPVVFDGAPYNLSKVLRLLQGQLGDMFGHNATGYTYAQHRLQTTGAGTLRFQLINMRWDGPEKIQFWTDLDTADQSAPPDPDWEFESKTDEIYSNTISVPITGPGTHRLTWKATKVDSQGDEDFVYLDNIRFYPAN